MNYESLEKELGHKKRTIADLVSHIRTRTNGSVPNYSLLLGAGASVASGISTGGELVDTWRRDEYQKLSGDFENYNSQKAREYLISNCSNWYSISNEYSSLFEAKFDLPAQRRRFVEQQVDNKLPSIGYSYLVSLSKNRFFDTVYTTNFDDLINEAFYQFSQIRPIVCAHDSSLNSISVSSVRPKIIKLHGDYLFDDIKSTLRETESLETNIKEKFIQFSKEYGLIVMGYSGNDRSIMDVINHLLKSEDYLKNGVYWCVREDDYINPELIKLLWKERVYFVKIDGFDETMAQIHHELQDSLSLEDNFTNSKKELIISAFTKDVYGLAEKSELIRSDINDLQKHKDSMDISNTIRELNEKEFDADKNGRFSEDDFKVFLNIDRLIKDEKYSDAKSLITTHINSSDNVRSKERYLVKLIRVNKEQGLEAEALKLCGELVDIDPYSVQKLLFKAKNYINITERCKFLAENENDFDRSYSFHNYVVSNGMDEIDFTKGKAVFTVEQLLAKVEKSLDLDPSLDNAAWSHYLKLIEKRYQNTSDKKDKSAAVASHVDKAKKINDVHIRVLQLMLEKSFLDGNYSKAMASIDYLKEVYITSSVSKRLRILEIICNKLPSLLDYEEYSTSSQYWTEFMEGDIFRENQTEEISVSSLVCQAQYHLKIGRDADKALKYIRDASIHRDASEYAETIVQYLGLLDPDEIELNEFLTKIKEEIADSTYHYLDSEINNYIENYDESIASMEKYYQNGGAYESYVSRVSFIFLKTEKYQKAINLINSAFEKIDSLSSKDVLCVNREFASKKIGNAMNDIALRNVISNARSKHLVLAAECLVGKPVVAKRLIRQSIDLDYFNYYMFQTWPVIPVDYLNLPAVEVDSIPAALTLKGLE
jgi:tetratricopeptide (TPR) repeat protein